MNRACTGANLNCCSRVVWTNVPEKTFVNEASAESVVETSISKSLASVLASLDAIAGARATWSMTTGAVPGNVSFRNWLAFEVVVQNPLVGSMPNTTLGDVLPDWLENAVNCEPACGAESTSRSLQVIDDVP